MTFAVFLTGGDQGEANRGKLRLKFLSASLLGLALAASFLMLPTPHAEAQRGRLLGRFRNACRPVVSQPVCRQPLLRQRCRPGLLGRLRARRACPPTQICQPCETYTTAPVVPEKVCIQTLLFEIYDQEQGGQKISCGYHAILCPDNGDMAVLHVDECCCDSPGGGCGGGCCYALTEIITPDPEDIEPDNPPEVNAALKCQPPSPQPVSAPYTTSSDLATNGLAQPMVRIEEKAGTVQFVKRFLVNFDDGTTAEWVPVWVFKVTHDSGEYYVGFEATENAPLPADPIGQDTGLSTKESSKGDYIYRAKLTSEQDGAGDILEDLFYIYFAH